MAEGLNRATLIGNLGADPELKTTPNGKSVLKLRVATTTRYKNPEGAWQERTEWHSCDVWGARATALHAMLHKGSRLYIEGEIQTRSWDDPNGGSKRYATSISANHVVMLDGKPQGARGQASADDDGREPWE